MDGFHKYVFDSLPLMSAKRGVGVKSLFGQYPNKHGLSHCWASLSVTSDLWKFELMFNLCQLSKSYEYQFVFINLSELSADLK